MPSLKDKIKQMTQEEEYLNPVEVSTLAFLDTKLTLAFHFVQTV